MANREQRNAEVMSEIVELIDRPDIPDLHRYNGFVPLDSILLQNPDGEFEIYNDTTIDALDNPLDIRVLAYGNGDEELTGLLRLSKPTPQMIRKMSCRFSPFAYCLEEQALDNVGALPSKASWLIELKKNEPASKMKLILPNGSRFAGVGCAESIKNNVMMLIGLQFVFENSCRVYIKPENAKIGMTLQLHTLSAAKDIFKMREVEPGRKRRTALKHFVAEHMRQLRTSPEEKIKIARYLRGAEQFNWNGFECKILIPEYLKNS